MITLVSVFMAIVSGLMGGYFLFARRPAHGEHRSASADYITTSAFTVAPAVIGIISLVLGSGASFIALRNTDYLNRMLSDRPAIANAVPGEELNQEKIREVLSGLESSDSLPAFKIETDMSTVDLPDEFTSRLSGALNRSEFDDLIAEAPNLYINGRLFVQPSNEGVQFALRANTLIFGPEGELIIGDRDTILLSKLIVSDVGRITSFVDVEEGSLDEILPGSHGEDGLTAGSLTIFSDLENQSRLLVSLDGTDGQDGGDGLPGVDGNPGDRGKNASDSAFSCRSGPRNGGDGAPGGPGGNGGDGGRGGNGGDLVLLSDIAGQQNRIDFTSNGGEGGVGGLGGVGGNGGVGGAPGRGSAFCSGASRPGRNGPRGQDGESGTSGTNGTPGSINVFE